MPTPPDLAAGRLRTTVRRPIVRIFIVLALLLAAVVAAIAVSSPSQQRLARTPVIAPPATSAPATAPVASSTAAPSSSAVATAAPSRTPTAHFQGPSDGQVLGRAAARALVFTINDVSAAQVRGSLDGRPITFAGTGDTAEHRPGPLADGPHTLDVTVDGAAGDAHVLRTFMVDTAPPKLAVRQPRSVDKGQPLTVSGTTDSGSTLTANGRPVPVTDGSWKARFATAPSAVEVVASDPAGNTSTKEVAVHFPVPLTRAVHMTARAWGSKPKHDAAMALLRGRKINAIEIDIKDEDGLVGYATKVPLAATVGAIEAHYDTKKMIAEVHVAGGRVIGRLVAFRDPKLTGWAWRSGHRDMVLQELDGTPRKSSYGPFAFPNFSNAVVQKYNVDLAVEAARLGFDDVLYDYVRRPDGTLSKMKIPGLRGTPERSVAAFVAATESSFKNSGLTTYLGVSVFGIAATRPTEIAQDVSMMAPHVDYVAPMVYPSHWGPGEYKVADPNKAPYAIVQRSLKDFQKKVRGTNAAVIPWLQDFSRRGVKYGPDQIRAQVKGAADDGLQSFLLWNAGANYTGAALTPMR